MSALESMLAVAGEAPLLNGLSYEVPASSSAVVDRKQHVRAYPTSASTLSPTGTRVCRIRVGGDAWMDSSSVRLMYTINNLDGTNALTPISGPWGAFSTVRLLSNGVELDNFNGAGGYGRHHELFGWNLLTFQDQWTEAAIGGLSGSYPSSSSDIPEPEPKRGYIEGGERATCLHKMHLSVFNSGKMIPLRYLPLELEITLSDATDWLNTVSGKSTTYSISNVQLLYDELTLDEAVSSSFFRSLLANHVLAIPVVNAAQFTSAIPSGSTSITLAAVRAFSKLSQIWVTFRGGTTGKAWDFVVPSAPTNGLGKSPALDDGSPSWAPTVRISVGGKNYPDPSPAATIPEQYYMVARALGYSPNLTRDTYINDSYCLVTDFQKIRGDHGTSCNTRSGDLVRIDIQNLTANRATSVEVTFFSYGIVAVREAGVTLLT